MTICLDFGNDLVYRFYGQGTRGPILSQQLDIDANLKRIDIPLGLGLEIPNGPPYPVADIQRGYCWTMDI